MTNLLFPTDFSEKSSAALDWVRLFAQKTGATVSLLHVFQPMVPDTTLPTGFIDPGAGLLASQGVEDISRRRLEELADQLRAEGLSVETEWRIGAVEDGILESAKERSADLIVMGRSDLSTFFDRLAGSAVTDVADDARCPVLIVPTTDTGTAIHPAQVHTIVYAMQPETTNAKVQFQTESLVKAFDAKLNILTDPQLSHATAADLIVMEYQPTTGFFDNLLHPNHLAKLIEKSDVPVLIYHPEKS